MKVEIKNESVEKEQVKLQTVDLNTRKECEDLRRQLTEKDARIKELEIDLSGLKQTHLNMVSEYEARIRELKSKISDLKDTIVALAKKLVQP